MIYQEYPVNPALRSFVLCYWKFVGPQLSSRTPIQHFIAPDACTSLVFISNPQMEFRSTALFGPTKYITETSIFPHSQTVGIRFKPGFTSSLFEKSGKDLRDKNLLPAPPLSGLDYPEALKLMDSASELFHYFELSLTEVRKIYQPQAHEMVQEAIRLISVARGNIKIAELVEKIPLSERQLQKVFKKEVGLSLKEFAATIRLRSAIIKMEVEDESYQDTVFDSGYYDQAHFIRDFTKVSRISLPDFKKYIRNIRHVDVGLWY